MKQLIVTGDDFGRSHQVNEAIERAHAAGFLTQASLMVNEPCAEEAVRIAQRHPTLCVGLHLTLCDGRATRAAGPLTDISGMFTDSPARAGMRYALFPQMFAPFLRAEIQGQFARFRAWQFAPSYWDGHTHLHLHPTIFRLTLPIAIEHGFQATRVVREPGSWALLPEIFQLLSRNAIPALRRRSIAFADHTFGLRDTGRITPAVTRRILQNLPDGLSEFYFHPGAESGELDYPALLALLAEREITLRTLPTPSAAR